MRERQARYKEEMKAKMEEEKRKRADFRAREKERKKEEQKIAKVTHTWYYSMAKFRFVLSLCTIVGIG